MCCGPRPARASRPGHGRGHTALVSPGEWITASGEWVNDRTHGQQFKSRFIRSSAPSSVEGIEKYLGSGMIRGIGPVYARKLIRAYGDKVFDVIEAEAEPERLREVTGIGQVRARRITDAWAEQKLVREIMVFLHNHGVGTARAVRIFRTYGADARRSHPHRPGSGACRRDGGRGQGGGHSLRVPGVLLSVENWVCRGLDDVSGLWTPDAGERRPDRQSGGLPAPDYWDVPIWMCSESASSCCPKPPSSRLSQTQY